MTLMDDKEHSGTSKNMDLCDGEGKQNTGQHTDAHLVQKILKS